MPGPTGRMGDGGAGANIAAMHGEIAEHHAGLANLYEGLHENYGGRRGIFGSRFNMLPFLDYAGVIGYGVLARHHRKQCEIHQRLQVKVI